MNCQDLNTFGDSLAPPNQFPLRMQEYYTSGFLSVQGAIDSYVLGITSSLETSLPMGMENVTFVDSGTIIQRPSFWTEWGTVFPTAAYIHNEFYDGVGTTSQSRPWLFDPHMRALRLEMFMDRCSSSLRQVWSQIR